ncbi:hypothetical protein OG894_01760 [Streptomyces sp. NBC_01724]|uniref:hypothetical protein n=1 Tax=unclassified Streptomyces TaxID=2593676 RepID=UPI002E321FB1|nr:hypothetical protein [Streptomyces sp. NBC_01724]WTE56491.1 hypothetical protein OG987_40915 [Streptomyces sp. NBC_01620]WTE64563.1 hypothetical protein OG784_40640 [Streptomyces sp. NBC_01617]WTI91849.1 hypothetical protein OHB17_39950 [Streptomyces sp. NBC_00724]
MDGILSDLGKRIADRWFAFLILPGVPFAATVIVAWAMTPSGAAHALDLDILVRRLDTLGATAQTIKGIVSGCLLVAGVAVVAVLVRELSLIVNRLWLGRAAILCRLMRPGIRRRRRLALDTARRGGYALPERYLPHRATWIGDRFALVDERVAAQYGVSLARVWPRLWQLRDDRTPKVVSAAWDDYAAATVRVAWALPYLVISLFWWPAAPLGLALVLLGWSQGRRGADDFCVSCEAAIDVQLRRLAHIVGVPLPHKRVTTAEGRQIDGILAKGAYLPRPDEGAPPAS